MVSMSGQLMLWDHRDLSSVCFTATLPRKQGALISLSIHPHRNKIFATGTEYGTVAIWDIRGNNNNKNKKNRYNGMNIDNKSYKLFDGHEENTLINDIKFLTSNTNSMSGLVTCGNDGITQIFQSNQDEDWNQLSESAWNNGLETIQDSKYPVTSLDFYEQLSIIATTSCEKLSFLPI